MMNVALAVAPAQCWRLVNDISAEPALALSELGQPACRALLAWAQRAAPHGLPHRDQFDILDLPRFAPQLYLVRCNPRDRFEYRLSGDSIIRAFAPLDQKRELHRDQPGYDGAVARYYEHVIASGRPYRCAGTFGHLRRDHVRFESVDIPLLREDGRVGYILGALETFF